MKILIIILAFLLLSKPVFGEDFLWAEREEGEKRIEQLFEISAAEKTNFALDENLINDYLVNFYPIFMIDIFKVFNPELYKDKKFTMVTNIKSPVANCILGFRFRISVGYSSN